MSVALFIVILVVLIVVHELGHLIAAKLCGMKAEEFGIGYPPRAMTMFEKGGTAYTLNWLPFGGFVKIKGEDGDEGGSDSFGSRPRIQQAFVLVAGIAMNLLLAWVLISSTLVMGVPRALSEEQLTQVSDARLVVSRLLPDSPAAQAGVQAGDTIVEVVREEDSYRGVSAEAFTTFVSEGGEAPLTLTLLREGETKTLSLSPRTGVLAEDAERAVLGVGVAAIGTITVPWWQAPLEGAVLTADLTGQVAVGLVSFFASVFTLSADLSEISGPVGIAGAVGDAAGTGIVALLMLTAIISINLALVNLLPVPALDGGRLLFVAIEAMLRRPLPSSVAGALNAAGFAFLILLMVAVTASDIWKLVS